MFQAVEEGASSDAAHRDLIPWYKAFE